ncbi:hypothetical protein DSUL_50349 [Desulfovibrionales bacterium]
MSSFKVFLEKNLSFFSHTLSYNPIFYFMLQHIFKKNDLAFQAVA